MHRPLSFLVLSLAVVLFPAGARADPWFDYGDNAAEDQFLDGDFDEEDHVAMHAGSGHAATTEVHGQSWVSIVAFERELLSGRSDIGGMVIVGLALDRVALGSAHGLAEESSPRPRASPSAASPPASDDVSGVTLARSLARQCVAAAWRTAGLGLDDARIDSLVARSRASALLPETRVRAMRLWDDATHATTLATTNNTDYYAAIGANLVLELRLTWRLDRVLYAGDEPTLERLRLERQDARSRLATRTLDTLFAWQRANLEGNNAIAGSAEQVAARLRAVEAEATLDVLTGGWFSDRDADGTDAQK